MELEEAKKVLLIIQDKINWELQFKENDIRLQGCINAIDTVMAELKNKKKIIELMAKDIVELTGSCPYDWQNYEREVCENICSYVNQNHEEYKCFIEYYEKKARGE